MIKIQVSYVRRWQRLSCFIYFSRRVSYLATPATLDAIHRHHTAFHD